MNLKNLRIGNKLYWEDKVVEVVEIHKDCFYIEHCKYGTLKSTVIDVRPIKITEKLLLDVKSVVKHPSIKNTYLLVDSNYSFNIEDGDWEDPSLDILLCGTYITCIEYLHELQNLIFELIREELDIDL